MHSEDSTSSDPAVVRIPLTRRDGTIPAYVLVDATDAPAVLAHRWYLQPLGRGYAGRRHNRQCILMHRFILGLVDAGRAVEVDHINGDGLDNRRGNLRVVPHAANMQNRRVAHHSKSGIRGVWWHKRLRVWEAQVQVNRKRYRVGHFKSIEEAERAVRAFRIKHMPYSVESATA